MFESFSYIYYKVFLFYLVAKTMLQEKFCQDCNQRHDCRDVYRQLGNTKGPSVVFKVLVAFLLPLTVFIATLAAFEKILAERIAAEELQTALSFLLALSVTSACILITKAINRQSGKNK